MRRLLLIGGGHAHVYVLDALARSPYPDYQVTLISPYPRQIYSGMLPGWIAGHYSIEQCAIPISLLARMPASVLYRVRASNSIAN